MNGKGVVGSVTTLGRVLIIENLLAGGVQAQELSERGNVGYTAVNDCVINYIVVRRILIGASAERGVDIRWNWEVRHLSRSLCYQIQAILTRSRKVAVSPWRNIIRKKTFGTVIEDQQAQIKGKPGRVLANWRQAAWLKRKREFTQRRKLMPLFRRITENPFDATGIIIQTNEKILAA